MLLIRGTTAGMDFVFQWIFYPADYTIIGMLILSSLLLETTVPLLHGIPALMQESWHLDSLLSFFFLSSSLPHLLLSCSLFLCNGLTHHRWVCVGTSSEVLQGHMHDGQVNKQAGLGCRDAGSWSKFRITGKSQSSLQGHIFSSGMITSKTCFDLLLIHRVSLTGYCLFLMTGLTKTYSILKYNMYSAYDQFVSYCEQQ